MKNFFRTIARTIIITSFLGLLAGSAAIGFIYWQVYFGDHAELQKTTIMAKIKEETSIYYLDETTRIGSLFEDTHRRYVPIEEVPAAMVNAIVAAEDKNFYNHFGIDPLAILKAALEGLAKGKFRRGGSTLTQQTVKNIQGDWEPSIARKFREMIKALQLELLYNKRQILEFYLNQFHVAGNGNGIGIAARYYFNKDAQELSLVEAAFIAGSVKGPSKYNPFIKASKEDREQAWANADERKNYVLSRMFEQAWISKEEYEEAIKTRVPFNRGEFTSSEVALITLVKEQLEKPEVLQALGLGTIDEFNIAGLKVFTTLDYDLQNAGQLAIRTNLSRLETILSGFAVEDPQKYKDKQVLAQDDFIYGKVLSKSGTGAKDFGLNLSFGEPTGTISHAALERYAKIMDLSNGRGVAYHLEQLFTKIKVDDVLLVQVLDFDPLKNQASLELQKRPEIGGGMLAIDKGEVRAVISGFDTVGYNRAIHARRQAGSSFKTLVYFAAQTLGWSILDRVENMRQIFPYQGKFYFPRPDHFSPYSHPSILWTGIKSENISSVALTANLLAKVNFDEFKQLLTLMELAPKSGENPRDYHYRLSRKIGVSLDNDGIKSQQLVNAINEISPDLIFAEQHGALQKLGQMWWGTGYLGAAEQLRTADVGDIKPAEERALRFNLIVNNFQRMERLVEHLRHDWQLIAGQVQLVGAEAAFLLSDLRSSLARFSRSTAGHLLYQMVLPEEEARLSAEQQSRLTLVSTSQGLSQEDFNRLWGKFTVDTPIAQPSDEILLGGYLPPSLIARLSSLVASKYQSVIGEDKDDPYVLKRYFEHFDFRIGLGLNYVTKLAKSMGVYSRLEPVLSFPLGSNDVTIGELAKVYQTFVAGKTYRFYKHGPQNQINFIKRIEDRAGNILFEPKVTSHQLVDPSFGVQTSELLRKVVLNGTARKARENIFLPLGADESAKDQIIYIPTFGKTGTTNDYTTSSFAGYVPYPKAYGKPLNVEDSYVIAAYVGYDNNRSMTNGRQRIYGGLGALPMWIDLAKNIVKTKDYKSFLDPLDLKVLASKEWPLRYNPEVETQVLPVDLPSGVILRKQEKAAESTVVEPGDGGTGEATGAPPPVESSSLAALLADDDDDDDKNTSARASVILPAASFFKGGSVPHKFQLFIPDKQAKEGRDGE